LLCGGFYNAGSAGIFPFEQVAGKLISEINIHTRNGNKEEQVAVRTITDIQKAQTEIGRFQRELLLKLHKEGRFSDAAIKKVERDMDINELKLNQLLPKKEE
jgi:monovalent cation/hydrogen antiporter